MHRMRYMGVLSDDFAAVDFGEELCQTQPTEKANSKRLAYENLSIQSLLKKSHSKNKMILQRSSEIILEMFRTRLMIYFYG